MDYSLVCLGCGKRYSSSYPKQICGECSGILEVEYKHKPRVGSIRSFWDMERALPSSKYRRFSLGCTKAVRANTGNLYLKLEFENPTHSFKDRGSAVEMSKAAEYGYDEVVCASTGNMAYSVAYYAKLYGMVSHIFISRNANRDKIRDIRETHDARITRVDGDFTSAQARAITYSKKWGAFLAGDYCYRKEGQKTITYEIMSQVKRPTHIIVPIGNATLFSGMFKGFKEMISAGKIKQMPKMIGVQASGCNPIVSSIDRDAKIRYVKPNTAADAIAVGMPTFGMQAIDAIRLSRGMAVSVTDREMREEQKSFYEEYGLIIELGGIASLAAYRRMRFSKKDRVIAVLTGSNV